MAQPLTPIDPFERLSADDLATQREELFRAAAVHEQQLRSARAPVAVPGVCSNCAERCLPAAVYCDAACRSDHEARLKRCSRTKPSRPRPG